MWLYVMGPYGPGWFFYPGVLGAHGMPSQLFVSGAEFAKRQAANPPQVTISDEAVQRIAKQVADGVMKSLPSPTRRKTIYGTK